MENKERTMQKRLLFVSNRLPVTIEKKREGVRYKQSTGGLATGLRSFYQSYDSVWIGWSGISQESLSQEERRKIEEVLMSSYRSSSVSLSSSDVKMFYYGFCNKTIWPLFHYFPNFTLYEKSMWEAYVRVNRKFCDAVLENAREDDTIWIHDYQLMLLPSLLREKLPKARIGFFLHIPFPSFEIFRLLPWRKEILKGLLGADLIGFHTYEYVFHFLNSVRRLLGYEHTFGQVLTESRTIRVDVFPMGIDFEKYSKAHKDPKVHKEIERIQKKLGARKIVLSVDRLDYTKGILHRLKAYDHFLRTNPEYHDKVTLILVAVPSRTGVDTYMQLKRDLDEKIGEIEGKYGTIGWMPVWYLYRSLPFHTLTALYYLSDVALITPLRDGMNLIAKEYVAARDDKGGCLILSGMAGAVHELSEAIIVNPHNMEQVSTALKKALEKSVEEQRRNNTIMQERLKRYDISRWAHDFIERLDATCKYQEHLQERKMTHAIENDLIVRYHRAAKRILFLNYDGTLIPFSGNPREAYPDEEVLSVVKRLLFDKKNEVVIISGRDKETLGSWFKDLKVGMVAEGGVWIREKLDDWQEIEPLRDDWKEAILPVFELYMDRTPGSLIEEKNYSLVWHYRMSDPDLASVRVNELKQTLLNLTENLNLSILEGNKVIEVKVSGINKGKAALHWLSKESWDFILSIGDDITDEDIFDVLPSHAYSIKVGLGMTKARFNVPEVRDVRSLLHDLASRERFHP